MLIGIAAFHRDWAHLFSSAPFFTDDYYNEYGHAYLLSLLLGPVVLAAVGGPLRLYWAVLVLPSLVVRHAQFLAEVGPTNTWPPSLFLDLLATLPVLGACYAAMRIRGLLLNGALAHPQPPSNSSSSGRAKSARRSTRR
jgi:hypothetical protein